MLLVLHNSLEADGMETAPNANVPPPLLKIVHVSNLVRERILCYQDGCRLCSS